MNNRVVKVVSVLVVAMLISVVFQVLFQNEIDDVQAVRIPLGQYQYNLTSSNNDSKWQCVEMDVGQNIHMISVHEDDSGDYEIYYSMFDSIYNKIIDNEQITSNSYDDIMPHMDIYDSPPNAYLHVVWTSLQNHDLEYAKISVDISVGQVTDISTSTLKETDNDTWTFEPKIVVEDYDEFHVAWAESGYDLEIQHSSVKYMWVQDNGQLNKTSVNITDPNALIVARSPSLTFHQQSAKVIWSEYSGGHSYIRFVSITDGTQNNSATLKTIPDGMNLTRDFPYVIQDTLIASTHYPLIESDIIVDENHHLHVVYSYHYKKVGYLITSPTGDIQSDITLTCPSFMNYFSYHPSITVDTNYRSYICWGSGTLNNSWLPRDDREIYYSKINYMNVLTSGVEVDINGLCVVDDITIPWNTNPYDNDTFKVGVQGYLYSPDYDHYPAITGTQDGQTRIVWSSNESSQIMFLKTNVDQDYDGMADWWEAKYFGHLGEPPEADFDQDGLTNLLEYNSETLAQAGSNPNQSDSDDDSISDYNEIVDAGDKVATNPRNDDTDGDGLNDSIEQGDTPENGFITDPLHFDTDGDGLWDGSRDIDDDGHDIDDPGEDVDLDGEIDGDTNQNGTWESGENWTETDPNNNDTDEDGINDGLTTTYVYDGLFFLTSNWGKKDNYTQYNYTDGCQYIGDSPTRGEMCYPWKSQWDINATDWDTDDDGISDSNETGWWVDCDWDGLINAKDYESDGDMLHDSLEMGLTENENDEHMGVIANASIQTFKADNDTNTTTNMANHDTDFDGLFDGFFDNDDDGILDIGEGGEDIDLDGVWDTNELDPNNNDTDGDNLFDGRRIRYLNATTTYYVGEDINLNGSQESSETDPFDWDSDDDGIKDGHTYEGVKDSDSDSIINALEKDSDNDGIYDSIEFGMTDESATQTVTVNNRTYNATNIDSSNFHEDAQPISTTSPINTDTDDDMLDDGFEDSDKDGKWDVDETNASNPDSDLDGLWDGYDDWDGDGKRDTTWEDINYNGILDDGEDIDNDTHLDSPEYGEDLDLDGIVDDGETDPLDADWDNDGLADGHPCEGLIDTDDDGHPNCNDTDSDNDGIIDTIEMGFTLDDAILNITESGVVLATGTNLSQMEEDPDFGNTSTSPIKIDSDGDGLPDGWVDGWGYNTSTDEWGILWNYSSTNLEKGTQQYNYSIDWEDDGIIDFILAEYEDKDCNGVINGDSDLDGIWDGYLQFALREVQYFSNGSIVNDEIVIWHPNLTESWSETNPSSSTIIFDTIFINGTDTDLDGLSDGLELITDHHTSINGLNATNPFNPDTDNDNLWDGYGFSMYVSGINSTFLNDGESATNPLKVDTDNDGLYDGFKDIDGDHFFDGANEDSDGDGKFDTYLNGQEYDYQNDTNSNGYIDVNDQPWTVPDGDMSHEDIDGDSLLDVREYGENVDLDDDIQDIWSWDNSLGVESSPIDEDSDDDGIKDGTELGIQGFDADNGTTTTNPICIDSDFDGLPDGWIDGWNYTINEFEGTTFGVLPKWGLISTSDSIQQSWEGEDFNLDGKAKSGQWTYEPAQNGTHMGAETSADDWNSDDDIIPDWWETIYSGMDPTSDDGNSDSDNDGLNNTNEFKWGYEPNNAHTLDPMVEDSNLTLDYDDDSLPNLWEAKYGLDWNDSTGDNGKDGDPDNDGLNNSLEYKFSGKWNQKYKRWKTTYKFVTHGLMNLTYKVIDERWSAGIFWYGLNPISNDTDGDFIKDGAEDSNQNGQSDSGETWPQYKDTDQDQFSDTLETSKEDMTIYTLLSVDNSYTYTDPTLSDTDGDGISDYDDLNPLIDQSITLNISEVKSLDVIDSSGDHVETDFFVYVEFKRHNEILKKCGNPRTDKIDFPSSVNANGGEWRDDDHKTPEEIGDRFTYTYSIPERKSYWDDYDLTIEIYLWDEDFKNDLMEDDLLDISNRSTSGSEQWGRPLLIYYNVSTGEWKGDDTKSIGDINADSSGTGHSHGVEHMSKWGKRDSTHEGDAEIWFNIQITDNDNDNLTYWSEMNIYETNATNADTDGDTLGDGWEIEWDFHPNDSTAEYEAPDESWDNDGLTNYQEMIIGTNPKENDTDADGLYDGWVDDGDRIWQYGERCGEIGDPDSYTTLQSNGKKLNHGSIAREIIYPAILGEENWENRSYNLRANPLFKDIYVEVDWMYRPAYDDYMTSTQYGSEHSSVHTYWDHYPEINTALSDGAQEKVVSAFADSPILNPDLHYGIDLHIDDGCMGGGEAIDHINPIDKDTIYDIYYNDPSMFDSSRKSTFHYCVIADTQEGSSSSTGSGKYKNNRFIMFDGNLGSSKKQAKCFLHELGHNLMGTHDDPSDPWYNPDATHLKDTANYGRRDHCTDSDCALVRGHYNDPPLDYCDTCWNDLRLDWCF